MNADVAVVGAGVVGLACARALARAGRSVVVLERRSRAGEETSSHNSGVVHAGLYYPVGSRKAEACVEGRARLYAYARARGVPHAKVGKVIVATSPTEDDELERLRARGLANGVADLARISLAALAAREPNVRAAGALLSPESGVIDAAALVAALAADARAAGADVALRHAVVGFERADAGGHRLVLQLPDGGHAALDAAAVVNAAGLAADDVAALAGIDVDAAGYRQRYVKGRYFAVHGPPLVRALVYPLPPPALAGLGVHATVDLAGAVRLGPDVEPLPDRRYDYAVPDDLADAFHASAVRWLPGLPRAALAPDQAGVRPKLAAPPGAVADFVVAEETARGLPGMVTLAGIESPGLTAALALAERVLGLLGVRSAT